MKIRVGPYIDWFGPYQIARMVFFWKKEDYELSADEDIVHRFGQYLSGPEDKPSYLLKFCRWVYEKRNRKIKIHIDNYDTWSADQTLAMIIHPILVKLKECKNGSPYVDDCDVPDNIKSINAAPKENEYDTDEFHDARWDYVLDEMIWTFEQHKMSDEWTNQYTTGNIDLNFVKNEETGGSILVDGPNHTYKRDEEKIAAHQARMDNGRRLFAKYYESLWH